MLIDLLRNGATQAPDQPLVADADHTLTYAGALARAEALARGLRARSIERFACVVGDPGVLIPLFAASSAVGSEACAFPCGLDDAAIDAHIATLEQPVVVSDRPLTLRNANVVPPDELGRDGAPLPPASGPAPLLILTTGTTGHPRAARHDWGGLVKVARHVEDPGARWLLGYNLNQFAGITAMIHVLASRATLVVAPSSRAPDIIRALQDHGVTGIAATPTFLRFVVARLDEASAREIPLRQITIGGEAVPGGLLEELGRLFPDTRIFSVYGATEFGLMVSVGDGRSGLPASVLERDDDARVQFRIVDGELHVRSRAGMLGYYGEDTAASGEGWRPTGDLVEVRDDRIFFVGRSTEVINVGGVKVHPLPVEERASEVQGVELVRAYGRASPVTGEIVVLDVVTRPGADREQVEEEIRTACGVLPPAAQPRRIRFVDDIEVREHKVVRGTSSP